MRSQTGPDQKPPALLQIVFGLGLLSAFALLMKISPTPLPVEHRRAEPRPGFDGGLSLLRQTLQEWNDDEAPRLGAALAFYSMLSIGPMLLIVIAVGGLAFGHDRASAFMIGELRTLLGRDGAGAIEDILRHSQNEAKSLVATIVGGAVLAFSATGFFGQLQSALNTIWNVPKHRMSFLTLARKRLLSFGMIAAICILLLFSLVVSAALSAITVVFSDYAPAVAAQAASVLVSLAITTVMFAMAFKFLPDTRIRWTDVWVGAFITAVLFAVGKSLIGLYIGRSAFSSTYGAAGSMIVLLVWIYYSAQIVFFGAEFTQVYARYRGSASPATKCSRVARASG